MSRGTWPALVAALAIVVAGGPARADHRDEAEKLAKAGELLFDAGKYGDALRQFLDAYQRFDPPRFVIPEVLWNIGRCYEELGNDASALHWFDEFRKVATDPAYVQAAKDKLREVRLRMQAALTVVVQPDGTRVQVDGKDAGVSPLGDPLRLDPGEHAVSFTKTGFRARTETVTLKAREARTLRVALEEQAGTIRVVPAGGPATGEVQVLVDGADAFRGSLPARVRARAGQRIVRVLRRDGTEAALRHVTVPDQGEVEVAVASPAPQSVAPAPSPGPPVAPVPAVTARAERGFPWHFVVIGSGAAMVAGGGVMTALAARDRSKVTGAATAPDGTVTGLSQPRASSYVSSARTKDTVSYILYGVGGAAVVGGVLWWVFGDSSGADQASGPSPVVPSAAPFDGGALLGATGRF